MTQTAPLSWLTERLLLLLPGNLSIQECYQSSNREVETLMKNMDQKFDSYFFHIKATSVLLNALQHLLQWFDVEAATLLFLYWKSWLHCLNILTCRIFVEKRLSAEKSPPPFPCWDFWMLSPLRKNKTKKRQSTTKHDQSKHSLPQNSTPHCRERCLKGGVFPCLSLF